MTDTERAKNTAGHWCLLFGHFSLAVVAALTRLLVFIPRPSMSTSIRFDDGKATKVVRELLLPLATEQLYSRAYLSTSRTTFWKSPGSGSP